MTEAERAGGRVVLAEGQQERRQPVVEPVAVHVALPVFERLVQGWADAFAERLFGAWAMRVACVLRPVVPQRLAVSATALGDALIAIVKAESHGLPVLLGFCRKAVFGLTDRALRGPGRAPTDAALKRAVTPIEAHLAKAVAQHALESLDDCLKPAGGLQLSFSHWAQPSDRISDVREGDTALMLTVTLDLPSGEATMTMVLPLAVLEPIRPALAATFPGAAFGADPEWRGHLARQVALSRRSFAVVLGEVQQPLSVIRGLKVGDVIPFDLPEDPLVALAAAGVSVAHGRLGRANGRVAFRFETIAETSGEVQA